FRPVALESRLSVGSSVRAFDGSWLDLALLPGVLLRLSSNSEIKIEELKISKDGNQTRGGILSRSAWIRLSRGKITVLFWGRDQSTPQFTVSTPTVAITPDSDCLFRVGDDAGGTRITCAHR